MFGFGDLPAALALHGLELVDDVAVIDLSARYGVPAGPLLVVGLLGMVVNGLSAWLIARSGSSLNMRAAFWHLAGDALGSLA